MKQLKMLLAVAALALVQAAQAAPLTLNGLGQVIQWRDSEATLNDIPTDPWGTSDNLFANRVGIYVEFANGAFGWATYSGILPGHWNQCCANIATPDAFGGFFTNVMLHGLNHSLLPMAWDQLITPFSNNFDLDYTNQFGSNFRASASGWNYVDITLYSSVAPIGVPEPGSLALLGLAVACAGVARRKGMKA